MTAACITSPAAIGAVEIIEDCKRQSLIGVFKFDGGKPKIHAAHEFLVVGVSGLEPETFTMST